MSELQSILGVTSTTDPAFSDESLAVKSSPIDKSWQGYVRQFGLDPSTLSSSEMMMFAAAKNLESYIEDLKIPMATQVINSGKMTLVEREIEEVVEHTSYSERYRKSDLPSDDMDVGAVEKLVELPKVLSKEWLIEEVAPEQFYRRLVDGSLAKIEWKETTQLPHTTQDVVRRKELVEEPAPPEIRKQHAYVLLDISGSMSHMDGRGIIARGLALAFLKKGYEQRADLKMRKFDDEPRQLEVGSTLKDLAKMARNIISYYSQGGTDIQQAISRAVTDIKSGGEFARADILLISDGCSELGRNPLNGVMLHTFVLGNVFEGLDDYNVMMAKDSLRRLKSWSETFVHLDAKEFADIRVPTREDLDRLVDFTKSIPSLIEQAPDTEGLKKVRNELGHLLKFVEAMLDQVRESEAKNWFSSGKVDALVEADLRIREMLEWLADSKLEAIVASNQQVALRKQQEALVQEEAVEQARVREVDTLEQLLSQMEEMMSHQGAPAASKMPASISQSVETPPSTAGSSESTPEDRQSRPQHGASKPQSFWQWVVERVRNLWY